MSFIIEDVMKPKISQDRLALTTKDDIMLSRERQRCLGKPEIAKMHIQDVCHRVLWGVVENGGRRDPSPCQAPIVNQTLEGADLAI